MKIDMHKKLLFPLSKTRLERGGGAKRSLGMN